MTVMNGRLTRDAEKRQAGDTTILSLRLAVNNRRRVNGEWQDVGSFFDVTYFPKVDWIQERLVKGARVSITGRLESREWQASDGSKRHGVEVVVNDLWLLDAREAVGNGGGEKPGGADDIPFSASWA